MTVSVFRIPRRLKLYRKPLLGILLVSLLPTTLLLTLSYHRLLSDAQESLEKRADRAYHELSLLLKDAEVILNRIASAVESDTPKMVDILQRAVYDSSYFREAGVIDENGFLIVTNLGLVDPPVFISPERRSEPGVAGVQLIGAFQTKVMRELSVVLSLRMKGDGEVNLLVNPNVLRYFLDIVDETNLGPDGFIAYANASGKIITADGALPRDGYIAAETGNSARIRVTLDMLDGSLKVVGEISTDWLLRHWREQVLFGVSLTIVCVFVLFSIFLFLFRRAQAFDFDLKTGLKDDEFELHYQPIIDLTTGACAGSEALIRWRHPDEGVLLPGLFIPSAEKTGLIGPIGKWVVKQAVKEQSQLFERFPLEYISINLSPIQLNSGSFEDSIKWLSKASLAPERFVFEVTERAMINEAQTTALDTLERLRRLGYSIAVDDFGTGYSGLGNLTKFEFGYLKIDRQFIRGINQDIRTNSILEAIVGLGHKLGVKIIAEGVETKEQREYLQALGVRYAQGWLFSIPLPIHEFEKYISSQRV